MALGRCLLTVLLSLNFLLLKSVRAEIQFLEIEIESFNYTKTNCLQDPIKIVLNICAAQNHFNTCRILNASENFDSEQVVLGDQDSGGSTTIIRFTNSSCHLPNLPIDISSNLNIFIEISCGLGCNIIDTVTVTIKENMSCSDLKEYREIKGIVWMNLTYCLIPPVSSNIMCSMSTISDETLIATSMVTPNSTMIKPPDRSKTPHMLKSSAKTPDISSLSAALLSTSIFTSNSVMSITPNVSPLSTDMNCTSDNMMFSTQIGVYSFLSISLFISLVINLFCILYFISRRHSTNASFSEGVDRGKSVFGRKLSLVQNEMQQAGSITEQIPEALFLAERSHVSPITTTENENPYIFDDDDAELENSTTSQVYQSIENFVNGGNTEILCNNRRASLYEVPVSIKKNLEVQLEEELLEDRNEDPYEESICNDDEVPVSLEIESEAKVIQLDKDLVEVENEYVPEEDMFQDSLCEFSSREEWLRNTTGNIIELVHRD